MNVTKDQDPAYQSKYVITSDMDWASTEIIDELLEIFDRYSIRATFFCTHKVSFHKHELALHPYFQASKDEMETLQSLHDMFPKAKGVRAHTLYLHSRLFKIYKKLGIQYDSNYLLPDQQVQPFFISKGILEIPMFFEDDYYLTFSDKDFSVKDLNLNISGLKVFNFHPIHVYLNTESMSRYKRAKKFYSQPSNLRRYRNNGKGIKTLLVDLLDHLKKKEIETFTLIEINDRWRKNNSQPP